MTRRLLVGYLTITLVVLVLLEVPLAIIFRQREFDGLTADVERDAVVLATIYEDALERGLTPNSGPADDYAADRGARVVVVDAEGTPVIDTAGQVERDVVTGPEIDTALSGVPSPGSRITDESGTDVLSVAVPVASGGTVLGALWVSIDTHEVSERVQRVWLGLAVIAVVVLAVMAGVGWLIARSVTQPIRRLEETAGRFSAGDLSPTDIDPRSPPELANLEVAMNDMARRLDGVMERQRSFVADASHQLRSPLTALRLRLENAQSEAPDDALSDQLGRAIDETTRLATLVDDLLRLARAEEVQGEEIVELGGLLRDRIDIWSATADMSDVELRVEVPDGPVFGVSTRGGIEQILDNLLDNAIRAAPGGTAVTATLTKSADRHEIAIADLGPGLADDDKESAVSRFWRSDTSEPGTGLGLAIVDAIAGSSGGSLLLSDNDPTGLVATVRIISADGAQPGSSTDGSLS